MRFVILEHNRPILHWDLMLEAGDVLQTWRLAAPPTNGAIIDATALGDHRRAYLDYEGPISGGRGSVKRWDAGDFSEEADSMPTVRRFLFHGTHVSGRVCLEQAGGAMWRWQWRQ